MTRPITISSAAVLRQSVLIEPYMRGLRKEQKWNILVTCYATGHGEKSFPGGKTIAMAEKTRMNAPSHPGRFVWTEVIQPLGLSVTDAALALGVTRPALSKLLNGRASLSPEMALRIEKAFGVAMDTLMRMQSSYDIAEARKNEKKIHVLPFQGRPGLSQMKSAS